MRKKPFKVSIIIPAYNAEEYIVRCIHSLQNQAYKNIEIIVVDDGSTDSTISVINKLKTNDDRIILVKNRHAGPNMARLKGINISSGEYIMFIDSDDFIVKNAIFDLVSQFKKNNVDAIRFNGIMLPSKKKFNSIHKNEIINHESVIKLLMTTNKLNSLCLQIYKAECLKNEDFFNIGLSYGEDYYSNLMIHQNTNNILLFDDALYCYCVNPKSTTRKKTREQILNNVSDRIFVSMKAIEIASSYDKRLKNEVICSQMEMIVYCVFQLKKAKNYTKKDFVKDLKRVLPEKYTSHIDKIELKRFMKSFNVIAIIKHRIIMALLNRDYGRLWRYMCIYDNAKRMKIC